MAAPAVWLELMSACAGGTREAEAGIVLGAAMLTGDVLGTVAGLPAGGSLAGGSGGKAAWGAAAGVFRGVFLGVAAPCGCLLGDGARLGYSLLAEVSLREVVVRTASGPTAR